MSGEKESLGMNDELVLRGRVDSVQGILIAATWSRYSVSTRLSTFAPDTRHQPATALASVR